MNKNIVYRNIEIVLILIVILLLSWLIGIYIYKLDYKEYAREYDFLAYKVTTTENSFTITSYYPEGDLKVADTYILENGQAVGYIYEIHHKTINKAKQVYENFIWHEEELGHEKLYDTTRNKNVVIRKAIDYRSMFEFGAITEEEIATQNLILSFTTNEQWINYALEHVHESHAVEFTRVY